MLGVDVAGEFAVEQLKLAPMIESEGGHASDELLEQRRRTVERFEGILEATKYVSISADFRVQRPMGSGLPGDSGYSVDKLRLPSSDLWVGPLNHQTVGYAELTGIHTLDSRGPTPFVAWRGEPWLSPGHPLIADMTKISIQGVDERAEEFTATREFGINCRTMGPYWSRLEGRSIDDIREILEQTFRELLEEDDSDFDLVNDEKDEAYCANLGQGFGFHNMFVTFATDGSLSRIETGAFYDREHNTRIDFFQTNDDDSVFAHRPHTSFNHRNDYVPETTIVKDLEENRYGQPVMDFRMILGHIERLVMAPVKQDSHVSGVGYYAKKAVD